MVQYKGKSRKELTVIRERLLKKRSSLGKEIYQIELAIHALKKVSRVCAHCKNFNYKASSGQTIKGKKHCAIKNRFYNPKHFCEDWKLKS